jgi:hypothetical protein
LDNYVNQTHETTMASMDPSLSAAIRKHAEKYGLGDIEKNPLVCIETTTTLNKKGLFGTKSEQSNSAVLLSGGWLIYAAAKENTPPGVISALLKDITAQDYEKSASYKLIPNTGLEIFGIHPNSTEGAGSIFIALGPEPVSMKFREMVKELSASAK